MYHRPLFIIVILAVFPVALNAGFFYTWSFTIMHSLDLLEQNQAINAMRSINTNIRTGWFAAIFFGSAGILFLSTLVAIVQKEYKVFVFLGLALLCIVGNILVTTSIHLPLNAALEAGSLSVWSEYSNEWTAKNHWRTLASLLALLFTLLALLAAATRRSRSGSAGN